MEPTAEKSLIVVEGRKPEPEAASVQGGALMQIIERAARDPSYDVAKLTALLAVKK